MTGEKKSVTQTIRPGYHDDIAEKTSLQEISINLSVVIFGS